ncbi:hypothetical protein KAJ27_16040, partial [bacterium]|nr:hypothetical protein [bacterium]
MISKEERKNYLESVYGEKNRGLLDTALEVKNAREVQDRLYKLGYAMEKTSEGVYNVSSAAETHRTQRGMCFDGFIYGFALSLGLSNDEVEFPGIILGIHAFELYGEKYRRSDHAVLPFFDVNLKKWGAVGHSRYKDELTWRDAVYETLEELAISYKKAFDSHKYYFQGYVVVDFDDMSQEVNDLEPGNDWIDSEKNLVSIARRIWNYPITKTAGNAELPPADKFFGPV